MSQSQAVAADAVPSEQIITVFHDPINYNAKHLLQHSWTLWFDSPQKKSTHANWQANLKRVATVNTVEDFWGLYKSILTASDIPIGANYHFFRSDIQPMWEDPANEHGGKWTFSGQKAKRNFLNDIWLNLLLAIVGSCFSGEANDEVCGIVLAPRQKIDRISLWTRSIEPRPMVESIGHSMKGFILAACSDHLRLSFQPHEDSLSSNFAGSQSYSKNDSRDLYSL